MEKEEIKKVEKNLKKIPCIELAYLFGSAISGRTGKLSDIDIGIYLDGGLSKEEMIEMRLKLISEFVSLLRKERVDVIIMNNAPISLNYEIIKCNRPIFVRNEGKRIDVEQRILSEYLDRRYHEKIAEDIFLRRVKEKGIGYR
jgi:hypothetical protein